MCGHHNFKISRFYFVAAVESVEASTSPSVFIVHKTNIFKYLQDYYNSQLNIT